MGDYMLSEEGAILTYCQNATRDKDLCDLCIETLRFMSHGDLSRRRAYDLVSICTGDSYHDFDLIVSVLNHIRRHKAVKCSTIQGGE